MSHLKKNARKPKAQDLNSKFGAVAENKSKSNSKLHIYNFLILVRTKFTKPKRKTKSSLRREKSLQTLLLLMSVRKKKTLVPEKILVIFKRDLALAEMTIT